MFEMKDKFLEVVKVGMLINWQILDPTDITLYNSAPQGEGMHIAITVSDIVMNVSPATISQVTATLAGLSPKPVSAYSHHSLNIINNVEQCFKIMSQYFFIQCYFT